MLETLAQWFVEGGWGSLAVAAWVPFAWLIALAAGVAALAKWRAAMGLGAASVVMAIVILASGATGVYAAQAQAEQAYGGEMLQESVKANLIRASHEEAKGSAKLALVLSLPLLLVGALALYRGTQRSVETLEPTRPLRKKVQRIAASTVVALAAIGFAGNVGLVLAKGPEEIDPALADLFDEAHSIEPLVPSDPRGNELRAYACRSFEQLYETSRSAGDVSKYPVIAKASEQCKEMERQHELNPSLFLSLEERAEMWGSLDRSKAELRRMLGQ